MSDPRTDTIGEQLRAARERRGLDLLEASRTSPLPLGVLDALERATADDLSRDVRLQAQLRMYARSLGIDPEPLLRAVLPAPGPEDAGDEVQPVRPFARGSAPAGRSRRPSLRRLVGAAVLVGLVAFAGVLVTQLGSGGEPQVRLSPPSDPELDSEPDPPDAGTVSPAPTETEPQVTPSPSPPAPPPVPGRPPAETTVQLLDGARDPERLEAARAVLTELGYEVVHVDAMAQPFDETVVFNSPGWEEEAAGLQARDARFTHAGANPGFSTEAALHVVVGQDWQ